MPYAQRGDYARGDFFGFIGKALGTVASAIPGIGGVAAKLLGSLSPKPPTQNPGTGTIPGSITTRGRTTRRGRRPRKMACS